VALTHDTHPSTRLRALFVCAGLGLALALTGCSGTPGGPTTSSSATPSPTETWGSTASPTPTPTDTPTPTPTGTPTPTDTPTPTPTTPPTIIADLAGFTVTGDFGKETNVTFAFPIQADKTLSEVKTQGTGTEVTADGWTAIHYSGFNGRSGAMFDSSFYSAAGSPVPMVLSRTIPGFKDTLVGKHVGDRVLLAVTGADGYDPMGGAPDADIQVGDTLVFVVDIMAAQLPGPVGTTVTPPAGLPTVTDVEGTPTVSIPAGLSAPTDLVVQDLITGAGMAVTANDLITVNYAEVDFATGDVIDTSYGDKPQTGLLADMIPGWKQALVGKTMGSRVLLVVPPALAYPDGDAKRTPPVPTGGLTLVYVVDILFTQVYQPSGG